MITDQTCGTASILCAPPLRKVDRQLISLLISSGKLDSGRTLGYEPNRHC